MMWPKPFATEAVIDPDFPVVRSERSVRTPAAVSWMWILIRSPGFIIRSFVGSGLTAAKFGAVKVPVNNGLAGACDTPLWVPYAKLIGSNPPRMYSLHASVFSTPVFWFRVRLSVVSGAQYWCAVQPTFLNCATNP